MPQVLATPLPITFLDLLHSMKNVLFVKQAIILFLALSLFNRTPVIYEMLEYKSKESLHIIKTYAFLHTDQV